jgi:hypothetical protein
MWSHRARRDVRQTFDIDAAQHRRSARARDLEDGKTVTMGCGRV